MILLIIIPTTIYRYLLSALNCSRSFLTTGLQHLWTSQHSTDLGTEPQGEVEQGDSQQPRPSDPQILNTLLWCHLHHRSNCHMGHGCFMQSLASLLCLSSAASYHLSTWIGQVPLLIYIIKINLDSSHPYSLPKIFLNNFCVLIVQVTHVSYWMLGKCT